MKQSWKGEIVQLLPIVAMVVAAAACWSYVPARMAIHWNLQGEPDGYGGKFSGLLLVPLVALGVYFLTLVLPRFDPGRANYQNFAGAYQAIRISITMFLAAIYTIMLLTALGYRVNMNTMMGIAVGALLIMLGNFMSKIRPNWFVGIRTPWTLSSKVSWAKTHRLGGWLFIGMGVLAIVWSVVQTGWMFVLMLGIDVGCVLLIFVYSYLVYRHDQQRATPAGTSPEGE